MIKEQLCAWCGGKIRIGTGRSKYCCHAHVLAHGRAEAKAKRLANFKVRHCQKCGCVINPNLERYNSRKYCEKCSPVTVSTKHKKPLRQAVKRDFTHGSLMHAPVNKLEGIVNGILSGRNTLQGVRR